MFHIQIHCLQYSSVLYCTTYNAWHYAKHILFPLILQLYNIIFKSCFVFCQHVLCFANLFAQHVLCFDKMFYYTTFVVQHCCTTLLYNNIVRFCCKCDMAFTLLNSLNTKKMRLARQTEELWTGEDFLMEYFATCEYSY